MYSKNPKGVIMQDRDVPPVTPGSVLQDIMTDLSIPVQELAERTQLPVTELTGIIIGRTRITVDVAIKLGIVFGNGPDLWLSLQSKTDLWKFLNTPEFEEEVEQLRPIEDIEECSFTVEKTDAKPVYVVIRHSKWNAPYGETYYYAVSYVEAQEFVDRESATARLQGHSYTWRIVSADSV